MLDGQIPKREFECARLFKPEMNLEMYLQSFSHLLTGPVL